MWQRDCENRWIVCSSSTVRCPPPNRSHHSPPPQQRQPWKICRGKLRRSRSAVSRIKRKLWLDELPKVYSWFIRDFFRFSLLLQLVLVRRKQWINVDIFIIYFIVILTSNFKLNLIRIIYKLSCAHHQTTINTRDPLINIKFNIIGNLSRRL